ncbi:MAG: fibronectin type III domain-containing protein [Flavobacteriales bacterium]
MSLIRFDFGDLTPLKLLERSASILKRMTNNTHFPAPSPSLAALQSLIEELGESITKAEQGSKASKKKRDDLAEDMVEMLLKLCGHVQNISGSNQQMILSSGFSPRSRKTALGNMPEVQNLRTKTTGVTGEIKLNWKRMYGAYTYLIQKTQTPEVESSWKDVMQVTTAKALVKNVPSLQVYYFRVAALGSGGLGPWSNVGEGFAR